MKKFNIIKSTAIPLKMRDVDTDMIIPAQHLTKVSASGYGVYAFSELKKNNKDFVLNNPKYSNSKIMLSLSSFGCGSSREHAVWAIMESGVEAIIASSFSDIFFNNSGKNGLLLIKLNEEIILSLITKAEAGLLELKIDLVNQTVTDSSSGEIYRFEIDPYRKECFLNGQDDMDFLLDNMEEINNYYSKSRV